MPSAANLQPLTSDPAVRRIMEVVRADGGEARVVGGAVRDLLLGRSVGEIDFAATLPPEKMVEVFADAKIKTVPTGIDHGTITAVIDGKGYEITTLRHDVETDGRRAKVAFTDDWQADAARRDFTMNALYVDADGKLYDYFDGRKDLAAGRVRFIGDAAARIREDVLRILRFFRFYAWFGESAPDGEGLAACRDLATLMPQLSVERVWNEIRKLLNAQNPAPSWRLMLDAKILAAILPEANEVGRLEALLAVEKKYAVAPSSLRRFAALLPHDWRVAEKIAERLKLSKRDGQTLATLAALTLLLDGMLDAVAFRQALHQHGVDISRDAAMLHAASHTVDLAPVFATAAAWENPQFPLQGQDLVKLGMKPGPEIGALLKKIENEWAQSDFQMTREECLAMAKDNSKR